MNLLRISAFLVLAACSATDVDAPVSSDESNTTGEHRLSGFDETILVGGDQGEVAIVHVGDKLTKHAVATSKKSAPVVVQTFGAKFHLVYDDGTLLVVDAATGAVDKTLPLGDPPTDIALANETEAWVATKNGKVTKRDLVTGAERGVVDLTVAGGEPRRVLLDGERLYVQIARKKNGRAERGALAVVDTKARTVEKVIELEGVDRRTSTTLAGLEPDLPMAIDRKRQQLWVTAIGNRPSNTGLVARIDLATLSVHDVLRANSGFQGAVVMHEPFDELFVIYHTSTPTTSSHLFTGTLGPDGAVEQRTKTLVDAFDGLDALVLNASGTLAVMANACFTGFCIGGAGLNFVDAKTKQILPKLKADMIGFEPVLVQIRR